MKIRSAGIAVTLLASMIMGCGGTPSTRADPAPDAEPLREQYIDTSPFDWINGENRLALDMACYDLMGKKLGVPAWKLIGPQVTQ